MPLTRRPARPSDFTFARRTHHDAFREVVERQFGPWDEAAQDQFFADDWSPASFEVLEWDGEPCGYVGIDESEHALRVHGLVIAPPNQGQGIGSAVVQAVIDDAQRRQMPVALRVLRENRARRLYERLGFVRVDADADYVHLRLEPVRPGPSAPTDAADHHERPRRPPVRHTGCMRPLGVHHVSINVDDVDEALAFYTEVLGLERRDDRPDFAFGGAWLSLGEQQVHLIEAQAPPALGQHFAIAVADLAATVAELRARGVEVSDPSPVGTSMQAFCSDPSGNQVELHQPAAV